MAYIEKNRGAYRELVKKGNLEDLGVDGRIILMRILKKSDRLEDLDINGNMKLRYT